MDIYMIVYSSIILILAIIMLLKVFFKIKVKHPFKLDKIIQREKDEYQNTLLYKIGNFADPITAKYISRYTIVNQNKQKSLIVKYNEELSMIKYNIYLYTSASKLLEVLEVEERNFNVVSREIMLTKNCKKINIVVVEVNNEVVNTKLKNVSKFVLFIYSLISSAFVGMSLFGLMYLVIDNQIAKDNILLVCSISLIYFIISLIRLIKKNGKDDDANGTD